MKQGIAAALCSPVAALAHPGHGVSVIHTHLADIALVAFGAFVLAGLVLLVRKALGK